ncbi:cysteine-rich venom protein pseudechetoxin-like [Malaclemys terrapin pileata]|uniref:cysteine-rich venom protein pseudechetoxin-like n=1 Tax=Malaclemys terrapin pileata TaxID=2991368 RepID=UPI0023A86C6F|nr:cysteine-rich venom protein pseudechetoxin-like [Malaclemys terrapin pileata]
MILLAAFLCLSAVLQPSTGQTPGLASLSTDNAYQQKEIVDKHNALRRGVMPTASNMLRMEWSPAAAKNAKSWANQCTLSHSPPNRRTTTVGCGENLYMSTALKSWSDAIQAWYNEVGNFIYGIGSTTPGAAIGHYTQVVWYKSYQIGCAIAYCPQRFYKYYYVCHYCPAGNYRNTMNTPYKSGPVCGDCPNACDNGLCTNPCKYVDDYSNCPSLKVFPGCTNPTIKARCAASCRCTTEIK